MKHLSLSLMPPSKRLLVSPIGSSQQETGSKKLGTRVIQSMQGSLQAQSGVKNQIWKGKKRMTSTAFK